MASGETQYGDGDTASTPDALFGEEPSNEDRVIDAALRCLSRHGLSKTTLDDVSREAGMSRATLYRAFPGGKDNVFSSVVAREVGTFLAKLEAQLDGVVDVEDLLTIGFASALQFVETHVTLGIVLREEPGAVITPEFDEADPAYMLIRSFVAVYLQPFLAQARDVDRFVEVLLRMVVSFATRPSELVDPDDEASIRQFVRGHLAPALNL